MAYKMSDKLESKILPSLYIQMNFDADLPKKCKSTVNSPNTLPETPLEGLKWTCFGKDDSPTTSRLSPGFPDLASTSKLKGLEEIGLFSEFKFAKALTSHPILRESGQVKRATIHVTDFMMNNHKRRLLRQSGGLDHYMSKKKEYEKELILRDTNLNKFFHHSEKKPEFYSTPPISPVIVKKKKESFSDFPDITKKTNKLDMIIEQCDQAMMLKPPPVSFKSLTPTEKFSKPEKLIQKQRLNHKPKQ
jgi:hypothetical protein